MSTVKFFILSAALASTEEEIISCFSGRPIVLADNKLPDSIQLLPPGRHTINASKGGQPHTCTVEVTAKTAEYISKDLKEMLAAAEAGTGPRPYIDFNHNDEEASGWPLEAFWAGDDMINGGVRAKLEWSGPGGSAVQGKSYRQFSPNFRVSPDTGEIIGTTVNMGGLVNRPAFKKIAPLFAKDVGEIATKVTPMNKIHAALVAAGLLSVIPTDEAAGQIEFNDRWNAIKARLMAGEVAIQAVETNKQTISALTTDRDVFKARAEKMAESNAKTIVAGWVKDGIIAPRDEAGIAKWTSILAKDPDAVSLMEPVISARAAQAAAGAGGNTDVTKTIVTGVFGGGAGGAAAATGEHAFTIKAKEIAKAKNVKESDAMVMAASENPALYDAYRQSLLFVSGPAKSPGQTA